jgi:hypothetical protein
MESVGANNTGNQHKHPHEILIDTLPGTMPSSTAALVAFSASVTLSFFSPTSASLAPPI